MDREDRELLAASVRASIDARASAMTNDDAIVALGWAEMLIAEPIEATAIVFAELGRIAAPSALLDDVIGAPLAIPTGAMIVHPEWGAIGPRPRNDGADLTGGGTVARARVGRGEAAYVVRRDGVATVEASALRPDESHTDSTLTTVVIDGPVSEWAPHEPEALARAVAAARLAQAQHLHGLATGMLALACDHAAERIQFGRTIGSFQAVRHKLAETHVSVEAAGEAASVAVESGSPIAVDLARVICGRAALDAGRHCQQVLAGIGFTRDHDFHRHLVAAMEGDGLYGTTAGLTKQLGRRLLTDRKVPRVVDL